MSFIQSVGRRIGLAVITLSFVMGLVCVTAPAAQAEDFKVKMSGTLKFSPSSLTVSPGDTITWKNKAGVPHNIVFENTSGLSDATVVIKNKGEDAIEATGVDAMKANYLGKGKESLTLSANTPAGTYSYYCSPHRGSGMKGEIVVQ